MAPRILIVTAADETYFPLLDGLLRSLEDCSFPIACFDVGLHPTSRAMVAQRAQMANPVWDLPVNESTNSLAHRASTARPFLPRYFPGFDIYLWIDADAWVQTPATLHSYVANAMDGSIAAATHSHPAYAPSAGILSWRRRRMNTYFGSAAADQFPWESYFNSGVFALRADAPHWACWADAYAMGLKHAEGAFCCDQTALTYVIWKARLAANPVPALCNWLCHLALPVFDPILGQFCEPTAPGNAIGVLHLSGKTKTQLDLRYSNEAARRFRS
jgi:lipopolysaccharide biosynthesis glycosyltransferase